MPYISIRSPTPCAPTLIASDQASIVPAMTGMPAGSPVAAAASAVTAPADVAGPRQRRQLDAAGDPVGPRRVPVQRARRRTAACTGWPSGGPARTAPVSWQAEPGAGHEQPPRPGEQLAARGPRASASFGPDRLGGQRRAAAREDLLGRRVAAVERARSARSARVSTPYRMAGRSGSPSPSASSTHGPMPLTPTAGDLDVAAGRPAARRAMRDELVPPHAAVHLDPARDAGRSTSCSRVAAARTARRRRRARPCCWTCRCPPRVTAVALTGPLIGAGLACQKSISRARRDALTP